MLIWLCAMDIWGYMGFVKNKIKTLCFLLIEGKRAFKINHKARVSEDSICQHYDYVQSYVVNLCEQSDFPALIWVPSLERI